MTPRFDLDPQRELFRWGPLDGTLITMSFPVFGLFQNSTRAYGKQLWPVGALLSKDQRFLWTQDLERLLQKSLECFQGYMLHDADRARVRQSYDTQVSLLQPYAEHAYATDFTDVSDEELLEQFALWAEGFKEFWAHAALPELATWGAADWIETQLRSLGLSNADVARVLPVLTAAEDFSFFQKAEVDLLLSAEHGDPLDAYMHRWYWIRNSYAGAIRMTLSDVENELADLRAQGDFAMQRASIESTLLAMRVQKQEMQNEFSLPQSLMNASQALGVCIAWQDERKGESWKQFDTVFAFLRQCEKRFQLPLQQSRWMLTEEILAACARTSRVSSAEIAERSRGCVLGMANATAELVTGPEAQEIIDAIWSVRGSDTTEPLKGIVVSRPQQREEVRGTACRIDSPTQADQFPDGAVLVTPMTTPDFMPIIRRAAAIVTDEGGLTAHAAVVSRELGIPCIVGTKYATQRIATGDRIHLNLVDGTITLDA